MLPLSQIIERNRLKVDAKTADTLYKKLCETGGFTYNLFHNTSPTIGYVVSTFKNLETRFVASSFGPDDLDKFARIAHKELCLGNTCIGAWHNTETDQIYLDVVEVVTSLELALRLARQNNQEAIYDLSTGKTVFVKQVAQC
jgi:hypothetical protein